MVLLDGYCGCDAFVRGRAPRRLGKSCSVSTPQRPLAHDGAVRVLEYQCLAHRGDRPEPEQFSFPAVSLVTSGVFGARSGRSTQLLSRGFMLLADPGKQYE